jgi:hypothetical protein
VLSHIVGSCFLPRSEDFHRAHLPEPDLRLVSFGAHQRVARSKCPLNFPERVSGPDRHTRPSLAFVFRHLVPLTAMTVLDKKSGFDSEGMQAETSVEWPEGWVACGRLWVVRDDVNAASFETPDPRTVVPLRTGVPLPSADVSD